MLITSRRNPRILAALQLRDRRGRRQQQRLLIDGARALQRAERAGLQIESVYVCEPWLDEASREWLGRTAVAESRRWQVAPSVMEKLAYGQSREGIVVVALAPPARSLSDLRLPDRPLVAVLEAVEKPGNLGAVLRSADAAGAHAVIVADGLADLHNPNVIRASMGACFVVPCLAASRGDVLAWIARQSAPVFAAWISDQAVDYAQCDYRQGAVFVLGAEDRGLDDAWRASGATPITIPMRSTIVDSLNLSNAAAVLLFEAWRQQRPIAS